MAYSEKLTSLIKNIEFYQDENLYKVNSDSLRLFDYAKFIERKKVIDLGSGNGVLSVLYAKLYPESNIYSIEINKYLVDLEKKIISRNNIDNIKIFNEDFIFYSIKNKESSDLILCNPPYYNITSGRIPANTSKLIAKHLVCCTETDVLQSSYRLLKKQGLLIIIYPDFLLDNLLEFVENSGFKILEKINIDDRLSIVKFEK